MMQLLICYNVKFIVIPRNYLIHCYAEIVFPRRKTQ